MGTVTEEPRKINRGVRFTVKEDIEIKKMMKQEEYLSVSKYIRDKALSKSSRKEMAYEQLAKLDRHNCAQSASNTDQHPAHILGDFT